MPFTSLLERLRNWAEEQLTPEELNNNLLLALDSDRQTAWHVATETIKLYVLDKLWEWANEELTPKDLSNKF